MCVCVCVHVHVCAQLCVCVCMHVCTCVYMYVHCMCIRKPKLVGVTHTHVAVVNIDVHNNQQQYITTGGNTTVQMQLYTGNQFTSIPRKRVKTKETTRGTTSIPGGEIKGQMNNNNNIFKKISSSGQLHKS